MSTLEQAAREALAQRITDYLSGGGLFNPEMANHAAVRDPLIECRSALDAGRALTDERILDIATGLFPMWREDIQPQFVLRVVRAALDAAPVVTESVTAAEPVALSREHHIALREAHCIEAQDAYFAPRPVEDGAMQRRAFDAGFARGFDAALYAAPPAPAVQQPLTQAQINALVNEFYAGRHARDNTPEEIVRAIERAHGIKPTEGEPR